MSNLVWRGDALGVAQVDFVTPANIEVGDFFSLTINRKVLTVEADESRALELSSTATEANLVDDVITRMVGKVGQFTNTIPEWQEVSAASVLADDGTKIRIRLTGQADGRPFTVTSSTTNADGNLGVTVSTINDGDAGKNEKQQVKILGTATGGTFTLTMFVGDGSGETTGTIAFDATAGTVDTALEALASVEVGDVAVTGNAGGPWTVEFTGNLALQDIKLMTGDGANIVKAASGYAVTTSTVTNGDPGLNEQQLINVEGSTGGTFTLTFEGQTTAAIAFDATAAAVESALELLSNITSGDLTVTKPSESNWLVDFGGTLANSNVDLITGVGTSLTGQVKMSVVTTTEGSAGLNEIQIFSPTWDPSKPGLLFTFEDGLNQPSQTYVANNLFSNAFGNAGQISSFQTFIRSLFGTQFGWGNENIKVTLVSATQNLNDTGQNKVVFAVEWINDQGGINQLPHGGFFQETAGGTKTQVGVTTTQDGLADCTEEIQRIEQNPKGTGGTFTLTFRGATTSALAFDISAAAMKTALDLLSTIDAVTVTRDETSRTIGWNVEFTGPLLECQNITDMITADPASVTGGVVSVLTDQEFTSPTNEIQLVKLDGSPQGGTFTLTFQAQTTAAIAFDASDTDVEAAIELLSNVTDVTVTADQAGGPWRVEFLDPGGENLDEMTGSAASLAGADIAISTVESFQSPTNEQQAIRLDGSPDSGTFTLTFDAQTTGDISFSASPTEVQAELEGLSNIDVGEISVQGPSGGIWIVTFQEGLGAADQNEMTGNGTNLASSGNQTFVVASQVTPTGPFHWDDPNNWDTIGSTTPTLPVNSDVIFFKDNATEVRYGLESLSGVTLAAAHFEASFTGRIGLPKSAGNYAEYRPRNVKINITEMTVGQGDGTASPFMRFDLQAAQTEVVVLNTGAQETDLPAFVFKGTNTANVLRVYRGTVGVAVEQAGDDSQLATLQMGFIDSIESDAIVSLGAGMTKMADINKLGGVLTMDTDTTITVTAFRQEAGDSTLGGDTIFTELRVLNGTVFYQSTGNITQGYSANDATVSFAQDMKARTVVNFQLEAGGSLLDPARTVTFTNPPVLNNCKISDVTLDIGSHVTLAPADAP